METEERVQRLTKKFEEKIREFVKEHGDKELDLYELETATLNEFKEIENSVMQEVIDTCHVKKKL